MVIEIRLVLLLAADSWLLMTSVVVAPEQAAKEKEDGALALAHSCG